jgi:hypothetical protein
MAATAGTAKTAAHTATFQKDDADAREGQPGRMKEKMAPRPGTYSRFQKRPAQR